MKKNSVITIVITALLCLVLFGMDLSGVMAQRQSIVSSNIIGSTERSVPVTFAEGERRTTLYINVRSSFGDDLPSLPDETWQWIDADGAVLNRDTVVEAAMTVYASQRFQGNDFLNGITASLFATDSNAPYDEGALLNSAKGSNLDACITTAQGCQPAVWVFEFVGCTENANICKYYVSSGGSYLNVNSSNAWVTSTKPNDPLYIKNNGDGSYLFMNKNMNGALNFKKDLFKGTSSQYFTGDGSKIYFAPKKTAEFLTLAFNVNGGNIVPGPASLKITAGAQIKLPNYSGTKNTHIFSGWSTTANGDVMYLAGTDDFTMPAVNTTLYAVYDNDPILWLDVNGGVGRLAKYFFREGPVTLPGEESISREGYEFVGWSEDKDAIFGEDGIIRAGTSYEIPESGDTILYAVWQHSVNISAAASFDDAPVLIGTYAAGDQVDLTGKLSGYEFDKWFYYGRKNVQSWYHINDIFTVPNNDVILYGAKEVKVTFDANDKSGQTEVRNELTGTPIDLKAINTKFNRENTEIIGWKENGSETIYTNTYVVGQADVTLKAVWSYTVTFNVGSGSATAPSAINGISGDGQTLPAYDGKSNGYDFVGWITVSPENYDPDHDVNYKAGVSLFDGGEDLPRANAYYALYQVPVYFHLNSGTAIDGPAVKEKNQWVYKAEPGTLLDLGQFIATGRSKRTFLGWAETTIAQNRIFNYSVPAQGSTLYAMWGSTITFKDDWFEDTIMPESLIGFNAENKDNASGLPFMVSAAPYSSTWVAQSPTNHSGHLFLGWAQSANSTSAKFNPGQSYGFPTEDAVYYAVWSGFTKVSFNSNGASGGSLPETSYKSTGDEIKMPGQSGMTREGYTFGGWSTDSVLYSDSRAIGYKAIYMPDEIYKIPLNPPANLTFYAVWNKKTNKPPLKFGILLEKGRILQEPVPSGPDYDSSKFTTGKNPKNNGWQGNIFKADALLTQHWVIASDPVKEPNTYYLPNEVTAAIDPAAIPTVDEIQRIAEIGGIDGGFNPDEEFVVWYVIKHKTDVKWDGTDFQGDYCWHVDGVILKRDKVNVTYDRGDLPLSEYDKWGMPDPYQVVKNTSTTVMAPQLKGTVNNGYAFIGWEDDNGKPYQPGQTLEVKEEDVHLHAKWSHEAVDIKIQKIWKDGGNQDRKRPAAITMYLYAGGTKAGEYPNGVRLTGTGDVWSAEVSMYKNDSTGAPINYTWREQTVPDGYAASEPVKDGTTTTITNTRVAPSTVTKVWSDGNEKHSNDTVTVQLKQKTGTAEAVNFGDAVELSASENWTASVNVPVYDDGGNAYSYEWVETVSPQYYRAVEPAVTEGYNTTITNEKYDIPLTITAVNNSKTYGDSDPELKVSGIPEGAEISYEIKRAEGEDKGNYSITVSGEAVQGIYRITWVPGVFTIEPKTVTVTADQDPTTEEQDNFTKEYGEDDPEFTARAVGLLGDDALNYGFTRVSGENVGEYSVTPSGAREQGNYLVSYVSGTMEITPATVMVTADNGKTKVFGEADPELTAAVTGVKNNDVVQDDESVITYTVNRAEGEIVGSYTITPSGETEQGNYNVLYETAEMTITKRPVTITAKGNTKVYDGTPLTYPKGYEVNATEPNKGLREGDRIDPDFNAGGTITDAGTAEHTIVAPRILDANGEDVTGNYDITTFNGTLEVTQRPVKLIADSAEKEYDGTPLTKDSYTSAGNNDGESGLLAGDRFTEVVISGSQLRANTSKNTPKSWKIENSANKDVTNNYAVIPLDGELEVTKKPLTIKADDAAKEYDGTPLMADSYTTGDTSLADGDSFKYVTINSSLTKEGKIDNVVGARRIVRTIDGVETDVTDSYDITPVNGKLTITKKPLTIKADDAAKVYDGTPLTANSYNTGNTSLAVGDRMDSIKITGSQTTAGSSENVPSNWKIVNGNGEDVTYCYDVTPVNGTLVVTLNKALVITASSGKKEYDGTALTNGEYTVTGLANGDSIADITVTGSQTVYGTSDNVVSGVVIINAEGEDVTESYEIKPVNGKLEVTKKALTVTADTAKKIYDGTELTKNGYTNTALAAGDQIDNVTVTGSQTIAGTSDNVPSEIRIVNADNEDVTESYEINPVNGSLIISKKPLTIKADNDSKVYDGIELTNDGYSNSELAVGDSIESVVVTGSQLTIGSTENVPSEAKIINEQNEDVTSSYEIKYSKGMLSVTARPLFIVASTDVKIYDGTDLTADSYTTSEMADGDYVAEITVTGSRSQVGNSPNSVSDAVIRNAAGENVTESYNISYISGRLYVKPRQVIVTADSFTKEVGQLDPEFTARVDGLLGDDRISYEFSREEGEKPGEYEISVSGEKFQGNYEVSFNPGKLTITYNPSTYTVTKVWDDDNNRDGIRPVSLGVTLVGSDNSIRTGRLSSANNWTTSFNVPLYANGVPVTYEMSEEEVNGYTGQKSVNGNVTIFTNTHAVARTSATVTKVWDDKDNAGKTRPGTLGVILQANGERILGRTLSDENNWSLTVDNLPTNENGSPITYVWFEQSAGSGYYAVSSSTSGNTTTLVNSNLYTLTIHYRFTDETQAAPDHVDRMAVGEVFAVESPEVTGYVTTQTTVAGVMPSRDMEITVYYAAEGEEIVTPTPTPMPRPDEKDEPSPTPTPVKDLPAPRDNEPDETHPIVIPVPNLLVEIDGYETALGLGEVFITGGGYSVE